MVIKKTETEVKQEIGKSYKKTETEVTQVIAKS